MITALVEVIIWGKIVFSALTFVGSTAILFHERYRDNRWLMTAAGLLALAGSYSTYRMFFPASEDVAGVATPSYNQVATLNNGARVSSGQSSPAQQLGPRGPIREESAPLGSENPSQDVPQASSPSQGTAAQPDVREADRQSHGGFSETPSAVSQAPPSGPVSSGQSGSTTPNMLQFSEKPTNYDEGGRPNE
jgi:hypothetical protein